MKKFVPIDRKLVAWVLLASTIFTAIFTCINFYFDYSSEKERQGKNLEQIKRSTLGSINKAVWDIDDSQINQNLNGLLQLNDIYQVEILDSDDSVLRKKSKKETTELEEYSYIVSYKLGYKSGEYLEELGTLKIWVTDYHIYQKIIDKMWVFFLTQGIKTLLISILFLGIFRVLVTSYLERVASYCDRQTTQMINTDEELDLRRSDNRSLDEFDLVEDSINKMIRTIRANKKELERELEYKEEALESLSVLASIGEMSGNIGHELNNPLAILYGKARILKRYLKDVPNNEVTEKIVSEMEATFDRMQKITKSLTSLMRSESKEFRECHIKELISSATALTDEKMKTKRINFSLGQIVEQSVHINQIQVEQVIINLLNNAIHAVKEVESPEINLKTKVDSDYVYISVSDNGYGIKAESADSIFVPFYTTKKVGQGTGLGLSISSKIIQEHGGTIKVDSLDQPTMITFSLPIKS